MREKGATTDHDEPRSWSVVVGILAYFDGIESITDSLTAASTARRIKTMSHWRTEIECHAAFQEGRAALYWSNKDITDQDAKWIASALANPAVRFTCHPRICVRGMILNLLLHGSSSVIVEPRHLFSARAS